MIIADEILQNHLHEVKKPGNYLNDSGKFALTVPGKLFEDDEGDSYFHIVWDGKLETAHRYMLILNLNLLKFYTLEIIDYRFLP